MMRKIFPKPEDIIKISDVVISNWHNGEKDISCIEDAFVILSNTKNDDLLFNIEMLSIINTTLWHHEDKARDNDAPDSIIAETKRQIDRLNAMRVMKVEEIDDILFNSVVIDENAPLNSETIGSIIDRLTILSLKIYHMSYEAEREHASIEHKKKCSNNLSILKKQLSDLIEAYRTLVKEVENGKRRYSLYRQFKMYNEPDLNPVLYNKKCKN
ncbi:MAG: DUF4254 domain-containing protein [Spirochaetota bacterium]|nr:DUF4254 domain-containing protein [Spirochaetota bacterium]